MTVGLTKNEIIKSLSGTELKPETVEVIAKIITENNKKIEKQISDKLYDEVNKMFELGGIK
jgi:hypothetical protein